MNARVSRAQCVALAAASLAATLGATGSAQSGGPLQVGEVVTIVRPPATTLGKTAIVRVDVAADDAESIGAADGNYITWFGDVEVRAPNTIFFSAWECTDPNCSAGGTVTHVFRTDVRSGDTQSIAAFGGVGGTSNESFKLALDPHGGLVVLLTAQDTGRIIRIDEQTFEQTEIASVPLVEKFMTTIAVGPGGDIYVHDYTANVMRLQPGASTLETIFENAYPGSDIDIDPTTGHPVVLAPIQWPFDDYIATYFEEGSLTQGDIDGLRDLFGDPVDVPGAVRIDPKTGETTTLVAGPPPDSELFQPPHFFWHFLDSGVYGLGASLAFGPGGTIFVQNRASQNALIVYAYEAGPWPGVEVFRRNETEPGNIAAVRAACENGLDDDGDGWIDAADPHCSEPERNSEITACIDGIDNDNDGLVDMADPDCVDEFGDHELPDCNDGIDNDNDGLVDRFDPHCLFAFDESEFPECTDGLDNNGNGLVDGQDPYCFSADQACESLLCPMLPACSDGYDNDNDGYTDFPQEPDCNNPFTQSELPACSDGIDNDDDGTTDLFDSDCDALTGTGELPDCNDGIDNDFDGLTDFGSDVGCAGLTDHSEKEECSDGFDNDDDGLVDFPDDPQCTAPTDRSETCSVSMGRTPSTSTTGILMLILMLWLWQRRRQVQVRQRERRATVLLMIAAFALAPSLSRADTQSGSGNAGGEGSGQFTALASVPEANFFSGSMSMSVPIQIPPGRQSATPQLSLAYSSGTGSTPFGYGWDLPLGTIERSTKHGRPRCLGYEEGANHTRDFVLMLSGGAQELVFNGPATQQTEDIHRYVAKFDEAYVEAIADVPNNTWTVYDRSGMEYRFGDVSSARVFNRLDKFIDGDFLLSPPDCEFTSIWALTQMKDPNGNTVDITYVKDHNTLYPAEIAYGANPDAGLNEHPFKVTFLRTSRNYPIEQSHRGVVERIEQVIDRIEVSYRTHVGAPYELIRAYDLTYQEAPEHGRILLSVVDDDPTISGDLLPPQSFTYETQSFDHSTTFSYASPAGRYLREENVAFGPDVLRSLMDMNGDGLVDIVVVDQANPSRWLVYPGHSNGNGGFSSAFSWTLPAGIPKSPGRNWTGIGFTCWDTGTGGCWQADQGVEPTVTNTWHETVDITGDGIPDFVDSRSTPWKVYPGSCSSTQACGFGPAQNWSAPTPYASRDVEGFGAVDRTERMLKDMTGDGLPDYLLMSAICPGCGYTWDAYINTGNGFEAAPDVVLPAWRTTEEDGSGGSRVVSDIFDFNGDGLPDQVWRSGPSNFLLRLNTGRGLGDPIYMPTGISDVRATNENRDTYADFLDVNGDGLPDRVWLGGTWQVQLNLGGGQLAPSVAWPSVPHPIRRGSFSGHSSRTLMDVFDFNGDGFIDHVDATNDTWVVRLGGAPGADTIKPLLLVKSENGIGGFTEIAYAPSSQYTHTAADGSPDHDLPFSTWVVGEIRTGDGLSPEIVQQLSYEGGLFDTATREFRGFREVTVTDSDGNARVFVYGQADHDVGRVLQEEQYAGAQLLRRDTYVWAEHVPTPFNGRTVVYLAERRSEEFSLTGDPQLDRCVLSRDVAPDDWGRVFHTCSLPCDGAPSTPGSCDNPIAGQVDTKNVWGNPVPGAHVRERPLVTQTLYVNLQGTPELLAEKLFYYDGFGQSSQTGIPHSNPAGQVQRGNVKRVVTTGGGTVHTQYDAYGNTIRTTDPEGAISESDFDEQLFALYPVQERSPQTNGVEHTTSKSTDLRNGQTVQMVGENGEVHLASFDALGRKLCEAKPGEDLDGCLEAGEFNRSIEYRYRWGDPAAVDFEGKLSFVEIRAREPQAPDGFLITRQYIDGLGRKRLATTQRIIGASTALKTVVVNHVDFGSGGRVTEKYSAYELAGTDLQQKPSGPATFYDYDLNGGSAIDPFARRHRVTLPDGSETYTYYEGLRTRMVRALGTSLHNEMRAFDDQFGRIVRRELRDGNTDALLSYSEKTYDGLGRVLTETTSGDSATTIVHTYDLLGREILRDDPDSGTWEFAYDLNGNLIHRNDPIAGQHVQWTYDPMGRVERVCVFEDGDDYVPLVDDCGSGTAESIYTYDETTGGSAGRGVLTRVDDQSGFESYVYDERGRIIQQTREVLGITTTLNFRFDAADRVVATQYPDGRWETRAYNASGQLQKVGAHVPSISYDLLGRPEELTHGNGVVDHWSYYSATEENHRLKAIRSSTQTGVLLDLAYEYNDLGKISRISDQRDSANQGQMQLSNDASYRYDALGRLVEVDWLPGVAGATEHDDLFAYSPTGNITQKGGHTFAYSATQPHQATSFAGKPLQYDENGRRLVKGTGPETQAYTYDPLDRLTRIDFGNGTSVEYRYDHAGRRTAKRVNSGPWTRYFSGLAESEIDEEGKGWLIKYFYAGETRVALVRVRDDSFVDAEALPVPIQVPAWFWASLMIGIVILLLNPGRREVRLGVAVGPARATGSALLVLVVSGPALFGFSSCYPLLTGARHFHVDHRGSTQAVTDQNGALVQQTRYAPYGEIRGRFDGLGMALTEPTEFHHEFTGYESEEESGLQYAGARYFDPELAQFISHDPERQYASPYAYGPGDPINGTDPDGTFFGLGLLVGALIIGAIAAAVSFTVTLIETRSLKAAVKSAAIGFVGGFVATVLPPLTGAGVGAVLGATWGQAAAIGVKIAMAGYGIYGTVQSARAGQWLSAAVGAVSTVLSAKGLAWDIRALRALGSGTRTFDFALEITEEHMVIALGSPEQGTFVINDYLAVNFPEQTAVIAATIAEGKFAGHVLLLSTKPLQLVGPGGIPLAEGSFALFDPSGTLIASDIVPSFAPFDALSGPTTNFASHLLGTSLQPGFDGFRAGHAGALRAQQAMQDFGNKASQFFDGVDRFFKWLGGGSAGN